MIAATRCRYAQLADLPVRDATALQRRLSVAERRTWERLRSSERRATWLAGRILAKQLLKQCLVDVEPHQDWAADKIHIQSRSASETLGERPRVFLNGEVLNWSVSIAHTRRGVLAAVSSEPDICVGVDLVLPGECDPASLSWCFTNDEKRWISAGRDTCGRAAQLWAMKEALFKACHAGQGFAPWRIEAIAAVSNPGIRHVQCWRIDGHFAALAIADKPTTKTGAGSHCDTTTLLRA